MVLITQKKMVSILAHVLRIKQVYITRYKLPKIISFLDLHLNCFARIVNKIQ